MELKDFVIQKLESLEQIQRETKILVTGINSYIKEITSENVRVGEKITYEGVDYEVVDFRSPSIYQWSNVKFDELKYEVLCLRLINGEVDKSELGKRIRKDKPWYYSHYTDKRSEKVKKYQKANTIVLVSHFSVKFQ